MFTSRYRISSVGDGVNHLLFELTKMSFSWRTLLFLSATPLEGTRGSVPLRSKATAAAVQSRVWARQRPLCADPLLIEQWKGSIANKSFPTTPTP